MKAPPASAAPRGEAGRPLSRAALLFMGATATSACSAAPAYGPAPIVDSGSQDTGGPVALYGPAPVQDSGEMLDTGGPVALYGPAIVPDAGADGSSDAG